MYYSLTGKLVYSDTQSIAVDCGGVAYHCKVTLSTINSLGSLGSTVKVYTHLSVRENAMELYGFSTKAEHNTFGMLITVSSIGPKIALGILSALTPEQIALCIVAEDYKTLTSAPGVGNKTAQRIVLELKDKIATDDIIKGVTGTPVINLGNGNIGEAISALVALGYSQSQSAVVLAGISGETSTQDLIKIALRALARD